MTSPVFPCVLINFLLWNVLISHKSLISALWRAHMCRTRVLVFIPGCGGRIAWTAISLQLSRQATRWPWVRCLSSFILKSQLLCVSGCRRFHDDLSGYCPHHQWSRWAKCIDWVSTAPRLGSQLRGNADPMLTQHRAQKVPKAREISCCNLEVWGFVSRSLSIDLIWIDFPTAATDFVEAWHLSQLILLFVTQAAMELESRRLLALLLLSLLLGRDGTRRACYEV